MSPEQFDSEKLEARLAALQERQAAAEKAAIAATDADYPRLARELAKITQQVERLEHELGLDLYRDADA